MKNTTKSIASSTSGEESILGSKYPEDKKKLGESEQQTNEEPNKTKLEAVKQQGKHYGGNKEVVSLIPNQRYVDHINTTFNVKQLTSIEVTNLQLYHKSSMGGPFPIKLQILLKIVEELGFQHIISWLPHGRAFIIHRPLLFEKEIMSKFFNPTKFSSFKRQLNLYDFKRITHGIDSGAYYHEMFLRSKPLLAMKMTRRKIKGQIRMSTYINKEPQFYSMPFLGPVFDVPHHSSVGHLHQEIRPTMIRRQEILHPDVRGGPQESRAMSSIMMAIGRRRGYSDTTSTSGVDSFTSSFFNTQSETMMTSPPSNGLIPPQKLYHQPCYSVLPLASQQNNEALVWHWTPSQGTEFTRTQTKFQQDFRASKYSNLYKNHSLK